MNLRPLLSIASGVLAASVAGSSPAQTWPATFADRPADSYSGRRGLDGSPLLWGQAPLAKFGSTPVRFDSAGTRQLAPAPAPGVHPRILFGPDEVADVRDRLRRTRCGQEAWKNILSWTTMMKGEYDDQADYAQPDRWNGNFGGLHGRVPLFRLSVPREHGFTYSHHPGAAAIYNALADGSAKDFPSYYWNAMALEAFRCLIDGDAPAARKLSAAVVTAMRLDQATRDVERATKQAKNPGKPLPPPEQPVGAFQLAFCYDFLFNDMTAAQRRAVHDELAASTWSHDNYGTFNTAETSRSNWATFSYWLYEALAIEGEPGFNELKVRGMYRGWRNLLTYGWYPSGATYEGEAKNQLGMDGVILFARRSRQYGFDDLAGHPYLRAYADAFLPHSINAMLTGFHKYDLLGGSRAGTGGFAPMDSVGLKYLFPGDRAVDFYYRKSMGEDYAGVPDRPDGYFNALLFFAVYATDFDPAPTDVKALGLGDTFFCGERALMMTRSGWDANAAQLNLHVRQANGGHPFADRNAIMVAGAGRVWSPNGYATFRTDENSVVCIDGKTQQETVPGRMIDYADAPEATFATGDAKYAWDWNWRRIDNRKDGSFYTAADARQGKVDVPAGWQLEPNSANDFAYTKHPFGYLARPLSELGHWIAPDGAVSPVARRENYPVRRAFRTAGLVRGDRPYALVIDDVQKDDATHHYDWSLLLEYDVQIAGTSRNADGSLDVLLTGADPDQKEPHPAAAVPAERAGAAPVPVGQPVLLVRVLNVTPDPSRPPVAPRIVEVPSQADAKKYPPVRRLVVGVDAVSPAFKVLLYPHRHGDPLPETTWSAADHVSLAVRAGGAADRFDFAAGPGGRTVVTMTRGDKQILRLDRSAEPLK